jgi:hypothetical protein
VAGSLLIGTRKGVFLIRREENGRSAPAAPDAMLDELGGLHPLVHVDVDGERQRGLGAGPRPDAEVMLVAG